MSSYDPWKRLIDIAVGGLALVVSMPAQLIISLLVRRKLGTPVLFTQERPGKGGQVFRLVKFRTMLDPDPDRGLLTDEQRITPFGALLRSTSLDELPTLVNVVRGEMSLVGPRPLLVQYLSRYSTEQARRHEVRPGMTGLAQVNGRNAIGWSQKLALDVEYVDRRSFKLDASIVMLTVTKVIGRDGIAASGTVSMPEFLGDGT